MYKNDLRDVVLHVHLKGRDNTILMFHWTSTTEIVFVTQRGVEFYQVKHEEFSTLR